MHLRVFNNLREREENCYLNTFVLSVFEPSPSKIPPTIKLNVRKPKFK